LSISLRQEGIALRPYAGLRKLEEHVENECILAVVTNAGPFALKHAQVLGLAKEDLDAIGVKVAFQNVDKLRDLAAPLVMDLTDIDVFIVAKDRPASPLRQTVVVARIPLQELEHEIILNNPGEHATVPPIHNRDSGFIVEMALVLNKNIQGGFSVRPREKGALIAKAIFEVKPVSEGDSFQPEPLTDEVRERFRIPQSSWMYADFTSALLTAETFGEAARFYVHESILADIQYLQGDEGFLAESLLQTQFVTGLIYAVSAALRDEEAPDESEIVESQVFMLFAKRFPAKATAELLTWLKEEPAAVLASWQSKPELSIPLIKAIKNLNGGNYDLSSPED